MVNMVMEVVVGSREREALIKHLQEGLLGGGGVEEVIDLMKMIVDFIEFKPRLDGFADVWLTNCFPFGFKPLPSWQLVYFASNPRKNDKSGQEEILVASVDRIGLPDDTWIPLCSARIQPALTKTRKFFSKIDDLQEGDLLDVILPDAHSGHESPLICSGIVGDNYCPNYHCGKQVHLLLPFRQNLSRIVPLMNDDTQITNGTLVPYRTRRKTHFL